MFDANLSKFLEQIPHAAAVFSPDGTMAKMNGAFASLFGVIHRTLLEGRYNLLRDEVFRKGLRPGDDLEAVFRGAAVLSAAVPYPLGQADQNLGLEKKDTLVLETSVFPVSPGEEKPSFVIGIFRDVTEQHKKQVQLAESEKRYRTLTEALPDMLFCVAPDQTVLFVNNFSAQQFRSTPEQVAGKKLHELFPKPVFERMWLNIQQVFETGKGRYTENKTPFGDTIRWLDTWLVPLCDSQGAVYAIMGVSRDVTEKIKYKEELEKARNLESLGILAGGIAHDFNNILTAIAGNISLLKELCGEDPDRSPIIEQADKAAERAKELTQQLLTFSKGGAPVRQQASIRDLILDSAGFIIHGSTVRSEFSIPPDLWPCRLDAGQISQVIQNLVINALQAMPGGGVVTVSARNTVLEKGHPSGFAGRFVAISVKDHGPGIPEENLDKVFIPFFTTKTSGNGLGLSICYSIVKKHEGFMNLESRPGEGATVSFFLPADETEKESDAPGGVPDGRKDKRGKRVLVIDDQAFVRFTVEKCLLHLGCRPVLAADGQEGLALFAQARREGNPIDAVILDLTIPGGAGGSAILGDLLKLEPEVRAIVTSGYANSPVLTEPQAFGFKAVLKKPFSLAELESALDRVL